MMNGPRLELTKATLARLIASLTVTCETVVQIIDAIEHSNVAAAGSHEAAQCVSEYVKTVIQAEFLEQKLEN